MRRGGGTAPRFLRAMFDGLSLYHEPLSPPPYTAPRFCARCSMVSISWATASMLSPYTRPAGNGVHSITSLCSAPLRTRRLARCQNQAARRQPRVRPGRTTGAVTRAGGSAFPAGSYTTVIKTSKLGTASARGAKATATAPTATRAIAAPGARAGQGSPAMGSASARPVSRAPAARMASSNPGACATSALGTT